MNALRSQISFRNYCCLEIVGNSQANCLTNLYDCFYLISWKLLSFLMTKFLHYEVFKVLPSCDSLFIIPNSEVFVNNFFQVFSNFFFEVQDYALPFCDSLIILPNLEDIVNTFFELFFRFFLRHPEHIEIANIRVLVYNVF